MASIPLPALDLKTPQQPDLINQYENLARLKAMQTQAENAPLQRQAMEQQVQAQGLGIQEQQRQAASSQAIMDAYANSNGDLGKAYDTAAKSGKALPGDLIKLRQAQIQTQTQAIDLLNKQGVKAIQDADLYSGAADTINNSDPQNRPAVYQQQYANLARAGVDVSQLPQQYPGDQQFKLMRLGVQSHKNALDAAAKQAAIAKDTAQTAQATALTNQINQNSAFGPTGPAADSKYRFLQGQIAAGKKPSADDQNFIKGYEKQKLLVPQTTAVVREEGYGNSREYQVYDTKQKTTLMLNSNDINAANRLEPGRYTIPNYSPGALGAKDTTDYFTKGKGGQQLTAFNTAMTHLDTLDKLSGDLNNSNLQIFNKAAQAWAEQTGNPAPANFAAAKNAMSGEVAAALKASGATDQEIEKVGETFSRVQSPAQLKGAIGTYRSLLQSKENSLQGQYTQGMQGRPNFQGQQTDNSSSSVGGNQSGATPAVGQVKTFPNGKTGKWDGHGWVAQ